MFERVGKTVYCRVSEMDILPILSCIYYCWAELYKVGPFIYTFGICIMICCGKIYLELFLYS